MVTVFEAGDNRHTTPGWSDATASARWPIQATVRPTKTSAPAAHHRETPADGRREKRAFPPTPTQLQIEPAAPPRHAGLPPDHSRFYRQITTIGAAGRYE